MGGFRRGLEANGGTCVFSSEIDKFAAQAYEALYGEKPHGDITEIDAEDIPDHDVLAGGFPCQAFSVAGKRGGFEDARGTLFFEMARIAKEKQPKAILAENVKGLVGHDKGRTLDTIVKTLNDIGYRVDFEVLNSKFFGVPQNRERIFIVAVREDLVENEPWDNVKGATVVPKGKRRILGYDDVKTFNFDWPTNDKVTTRLRDILEPSVNEKYYLSEEKTAKLVAQLEEREDKDIKFVGGIDEGEKWLDDGKSFSRNFRQGNRVYDADGIGTALTSQPVGGLGGPTSLYKTEPQMLGHVDLKGHDAIKRVYSAEGVSPTLTTMGGGHREPKIAEEQAKLNIIGHSGSGGQKGHIYADDGLMSTLTATDYKQPKQIAQEIRPVLTPDRMEKRQNGRRFKEDGEESFTLTAQDRHGVAIKEATTKGYAVACEGDAVNFQFPDSKTRRGRVGKEIANTLEASSINQGTPVKEGAKYRIRKLTPKECFRLQGFPDEAHDALVDAGISDSQRYKQAGNAVTVNVIEALGERLLPLLLHDSSEV